MVDFKKSAARRAGINSLGYRPAAFTALKTSKFCAVLWGRCHGADYILKRRADQLFPPLAPMRFSLTSPTIFSRSSEHLIVRAFIFFSVVAVCACEKAPEETPARTEPWKKNPGTDSQPQKAPRAIFTLADKQNLRFSLPTRKNSPQGVLSGISGKISLDLKHLELVQGLIKLDLAQLQMQESSPHKRKRTRLSEKKPALVDASSWTTQALHWLELGEKNTEAAKAEKQFVLFKIRSATKLSKNAAHKGAKRKRSDGKPGYSRLIYARAVGDLALRSLSVHREVPLALTFQYDEESTLPTGIKVALKGNLSVPLSEYEISPRDGAGRLLTQELSLFGDTIGRVVKVEGSLQFNLTRPEH